MLTARHVRHITSRKFSKYLDRDKTGKAVRQRFLDYFINQHNHNFVKSSPVVPFCDPTVAFVNAGMNQFKGIFLGTYEPKHINVTNTQKCIRVGGKHNDLNIVGTDGYHHTFFEMLGNWSFGEYFKKEACEYAWKLLTEEYKIPVSRLYVTYFKGDATLGLTEDLETRDIWRSLGVSEDRILPFGSSDNFWEMGPTGPCGPCTEIHVDHFSSNRANLVNKGLHDLTELWNIVFIEYNRLADGGIEQLPAKHVDTGMGFERLTAFLQGKVSNYDTDNFSYLFRAIHKICGPSIGVYQGRFGELDWDQLDTSYRTLADHSRMITVCLADGVIPEQNQKMRRVLRRAFLLSENVFKQKTGLVKELSNYVIENLGPTYPELEKNVKKIHQIIDYEEEVYRNIRKTASKEWKNLTQENPKLLTIEIIETPSILAGFKEIKGTNPSKIDARLAFKLYDTFGLDEEAIVKLAQIFDLDFNPKDLDSELDKAKKRSKNVDLGNGSLYDKLTGAAIAKTVRIPPYKYHKNDKGRYIFDSVKVTIGKIVDGSELVGQISPDTLCSLVLDRTNFYTESGGQVSDRGTILIDDYMFEVTEAVDCNGFILHNGYLRASKNYTLKEGDRGVLYLDTDHRLGNMRNHTAAHLINARLKQIKGGATCQKSSRVNHMSANLDLGIFGDKLSLPEIDQIERSIRKIIHDNVSVQVKEIDSPTLLSLDEVTLIPGEIYPDRGIRLVEVQSGDFVSREPCCGTHVLSTGDLGDFCLVGVKSLGRSTTSIHAVTGERAETARTNGVKFLEQVKGLVDDVEGSGHSHEELLRRVSEAKARLVYSVDDDRVLPFTVKCHCGDVLERLSNRLKKVVRGSLSKFVETEMQQALPFKTKNNQNYIVHCIRGSIVLEELSLRKASQLCPNMPVMIMFFSGKTVKAMCSVPEELKSTGFNAENWLKETVGWFIDSKIVTPKGQDGLVCQMYPKTVKSEEWARLEPKCIEAAKNYANDRL